MSEPQLNDPDPYPSEEARLLPQDKANSPKIAAAGPQDLTDQSSIAGTELQSLPPGRNTQIQAPQTLLQPTETPNYGSPLISLQSSNSSQQQDSEAASVVAVKPALASTHHFTPTKTTQTSGRVLLRAWMAELIACGIYIAFLLATYFTLDSINNKPLPNWSLNSLISFYAAILEMSLTLVIGSVISQNQWSWFGKQRPLLDLVKYDEAAREAWRSLQYLPFMLLKGPLTFLATLVFVSSVLVGPLVQQLVEYTDCTIDLTQVAYMPRTNYFNPPMLHQGASDASPLPESTDPFNSAMFSTPADVIPDCYSGNCTFPSQYSTVGFCSQCTDITKDLIFTGQLIPQVEQGINTSLPNGQFVYMNATRYKRDVFGIGLPSGQNAFHLIWARSDWPPEWPFDRNINTSVFWELANNSTGTRCNNDSTSDDPWTCHGYGAAKCLIGHCVRTYRASVDTGRLEETLIHSTPPLENWGEGLVFNLRMNSMIDTKCIGSRETDELVQAGYVIDPRNQWLGVNLSDTQIYDNSSFDPSRFPRECVYHMPHIFIQGYYEYFLSNVLNGTLTALMLNDNIFGYEGSQVLQRLYNHNGTSLARVDSILSDAATSLTNYIRQNGNANYSVPSVGTVQHYAVCVKINRIWSLLPFICGFITAILLAFTMYYSQVRDVPVWKSSPLAFLFHSTPHMSTGGQSSQGNFPSSLSGMKEAAEKMTVKLDSAVPAIHWG